MANDYKFSDAETKLNTVNNKCMEKEDKYY